MINLLNVLSFVLTQIERTTEKVGVVSKLLHPTLHITLQIFSLINCYKLSDFLTSSELLILFNAIFSASKTEKTEADLFY